MAYARQPRDLGTNATPARYSVQLRSVLASQAPRGDPLKRLATLPAPVLFGILFGPMALSMFAPMTLMRGGYLALAPFAVLTFAGTVGFLGWLGGIARALADRAPQPPRGLRFVVVNLTIAAVYMTTVCVMIALSPWFQGQNTHLSSSAGTIAALAIVVPHLYSMFAIFHAMWFNAKLLVAMEHPDPAHPPSPGAVVGTLASLWIFPVGLWFVQARVRRVLGVG